MFNRKSQGYTLRYSGKKFSTSDETSSGLHAAEEVFTNLGALAIRLNNGQRQRTALLGPVWRERYCDSPVEEANAGGDKPGIFEPSQDCTHSTVITTRLAQIAHYTLGKGKVLNELSQPVAAHNKQGLCGEQNMWDALHAPLWQLGINLPYQLTKQGFLYVRYPVGITDETYQSITLELYNNQYIICGDESGMTVTLQSGRTLSTEKFQHLKVTVDATFTKTQQDNGLVIGIDDTESPLGWIVYKGSEKFRSKLVAHNDTEDLCRAINLAAGGYHSLSPAQQKLLLAGLLSSNEFTLHTQNNTFNALYTIASCLEKDFGFDLATVTKKSLKSSQANITRLCEQSDAVEDFLTGFILTEMVQPLKRSQTNSTRPDLPTRFNDSLHSIVNTYKAVALAYDLKKKDGSPVLAIKPDEAAYSENENLIDVQVNGELQHPDLSNPKHAAAILATALLVVEQLLLEQLLRNAATYDDSHQSVMAFRKIISDDKVYNELIEMTKTLPKNELGPILGLQFAYCCPIITKLRSHLGHGRLSALADKLFSSTSYDVTMDAKTSSTLSALYNAGEILQSLPETDVSGNQSRGVNAGLSLVIDKLALTKQHQSRSQRYYCSLFAAGAVAVGAAAAAVAINSMEFR